MAIDILQLDPNEMISIERESEPGVYYRCMITHDHRLMIQDRYVHASSANSLRSYMKSNGLTQTMMADIMGVSRATINRYLNGDRPVPDKYFHMLGISVLNSELGRQEHLDRLYSVAAKAKAVSEQLDDIVGLVKINTKEG